MDRFDVGEAPQGKNCWNGCFLLLSLTGGEASGLHSIDSMKSTAATGIFLLPVIEHSELLRGL
jgi:hypothetical protein